MEYRQEEKELSLTVTKKLPTEEKGILIFSLKEIFERIQKKEFDENFEVHCSFIEIYKEKIYDLLRENFEDQQKIFVYENQENKDFIVHKATLKKISNMEEAIHLLNMGK